MRMTLLALASCAIWSQCTIAAAESPTVAWPPLASLIAAPDKDVIATFESAGMRDIRPHVLTSAELARVNAALQTLPALHRVVLEKNLRRLSFVDGIPGQGTGLTSKVGETSKFDITLRASLLDESLSAFLTTKERRLFKADDTGNSVTVDALGTDALTYVLLHEATHVVDISMGITSQPNSPFVAGIWLGRAKLDAQYAQSPAATTPFRGGQPVPLGHATTIYDALAHTPFVSLYATAAAPEDLAELVAWHQVAQRQGSAFTITVRDADGVALKQYKPLDFPAVKARMAQVDALLMAPQS